MEQPKNVKASSEERTDTSKNTEEKSADAMEVMLNSIVRERKLMFDLNTTFENFDMEKEITETVERKTFSKYQEKIEKEYSKKIEEIQSDFNRKLDEQNLLQEEINKLREENRNYEEKIKDMEKTNEQINSKYKDACTEQKHAQGECINLKAQITILEKTYAAETQVWEEKLSFIRTERSVEPNREEFDRKIKKIERMYEQHLEELKKELWSYDLKIKQYKKEAQKAEIERNHLLDQKSEQESEFIKLKTEQDELKKQIRKYESLLIQKIETYSTAEIKKKTTVETKVHTETKSEESSKTEITKASESHKDSNKTTESDKKQKPLSIKEVDSTGNFLVIHNNDKSDFDMSNLVIERTHSKGMVSFEIPNGNKISAEKDLKILSKSAAGMKRPGDIVTPFTTWGTGNGTIKVRDANKAEMILYHIK